MFISLSSHVLWYLLSSGGTYVQEFLGFYSKIYASCISSFYSGRLDDRIFLLLFFVVFCSIQEISCRTAVRLHACGHA